jgi:thioredoxin reductase (NADPH)
MGHPSKDYDCVVIGGGPAGLTAALYLARYHLSLTLIDAGRSRAERIAWSHNLPGFPEGISGSDLLGRMRRQVAALGIDISVGQVDGLKATADGFEVGAGHKKISTATILLATGTCNRPPPIAPDLHDEALARGRLRYCPVCDGFEVTDKALGVIGTGARGIAEARFLRSFSETITLIAPDGRHDLADDHRAAVAGLGIEMVDGPARVERLTPDGIVVITHDGEHIFDSVYPALGSDCQSGLAAQLGARLSEDGDVITDPHQRTSIAGLYAAGDVVKGLDQISNAMGQGGIAATAIRNDLAARRPLIRRSIGG